MRVKMPYFNELCSLLLLLCLASYTHECGVPADCSKRIVDLCLVLDASASVCTSDPNYVKGTDTTCGHWKSTLKFAQDIVGKFEIGENQARVSVAVFATKAYMRWGLTKYYDKTALQTAIGQLEYIKGYTNTSGALDLLRTKVFFGPGDRTSVDNVAIIVTSSNPYPNSDNLQSASNAVQAQNIKVYAVGVSGDIDEQTLKEISSEPKQEGETYFIAPDYSDLDIVLNSLLTGVCPST